MIPWVVTIVRSWPTSERDEPRVATKRVADPWRFDGCPPELGRELRHRPYWAMQAYHEEGATSFVIAARDHRKHSEYEWLLEPAQRAAILENLRDQCARGKVERLPDSIAMPLDDPQIVFTPDMSSFAIVELGPMRLRFAGYGATAR